ncbi:hypothetical protein EPUS_05531 [Endocarpon pusillum Z07020]|uniref:GH26 domain-containing protein n=1 Tax=Endocarpon pusillum (strain Z07020 / HMAS-L-300199) TaxID=1263415 RepID=U1GPE4_ENDPU|nr:uncharacterized protein EPUS_05531 [Endocarpon pusillum Z07020]ERF73826.1 hypothetical protein EPUS_05531 [Endocarpon pusillum Z07020]
MYFSFLILAVLLARVLAVFNIDSSPNAVGICYSVWHSLGFKGPQPPDITEIENGRGSFAGRTAWHFWGRPAGGYYGGGNRNVLKRHFSQLSDAKVDFIVIDATNLQGYGNYAPGLFTEPSDVLLDEMRLQRAAGKPTPHVVFWVRTDRADSDPTAVGRFVLDRYYRNPAYSDFWVTLSGKPLLVTTDTRPGILAQNFTLRKMWGLQGKLAVGEWSFLQDAPQNVGMKNGLPEQVSVSTAKQATYMSNKATATPRKQGKTYQLQWQRAFDVRPKVVILTWWNEWMAQRQADDASGNPQFVDNYNGEYSRDIEPQDPAQSNSHGSIYFTWTKAYVSAYKSNQPLPRNLVGY